MARRYFAWLLGTRNDVYYADGRSNTQDVGRHSLGTRDREEALGILRRLDLVKAVEFGLADASLLGRDQDALLKLEDGRRKYMDYVSRPAVQGGGTAGTVKRYRTVLDKFLAFALPKRVHHWQQVGVSQACCVLKQRRCCRCHSLTCVVARPDHFIFIGGGALP